MKKLIQYEYTRPGKDKTVFDQWLIMERADVKVMLLEAHQGRRLQIGAETILDPGAPALWFVFPGAWYDVGRFHLSDGTFTGWYTNICTPVELRGDTWSSTDLFLDHWMASHGSQEWLDEAEFMSAMSAEYIGHQAYARVAAERVRIDQAIADNDWPPAIARDLDLDHARKLMES
jgi:predicted RNA-binding protein associated with RNAse of E/G family